jgi:multidrug resistance efflux pump
MLGTLTRVLLTGAVVLAAAGVAAYKYWDYVVNPWTRDGQVRAQVVQITPRVSAPIVQLPIDDNRLVQKGDLLFRIDPRTFQATVDQKQAELDETIDDIQALEKTVEAGKATVAQYESLVKQAAITIRGYTAAFNEAKTTLERISQAAKSGAVSKQQLDESREQFDVAQAQLDGAQARQIQVNAQKLQTEADLARAEADLGAPGDANAHLRAAKAALETAALDVEFTQVKAPVTGYITNLNLRLGDQAVTNQAALALVDITSFWIDAFFKETVTARIRPGDRAVVTLMSHPDQPIEGRVDSLGWGISQDDGSTGSELLPTISPTFEWIRLAQRVPVRVHLLKLPDGVKLRVGTTASVLVLTGAQSAAHGAPVAAPAALQ